MVVEAPKAVIFGSNNFVAKRLGELLVSRGIFVVWDDEEVGRPLYFFDFGGGEKRYEEMMEKGVKICRVEINTKLQTSNFKQENGLDVRIVILHNVYGVGMDTDWWFPEAVDLAARNKNLILPKYGDNFRLLAVDDAVEAIMRAVIMSGTGGKTFGVAGKEIDSKEVATCLIDLAKMTKVEIREIGEKLQHQNLKFQTEEEFESSARALRWRPVVEFKEGIKEVVEEAVARVDEEGRRGKIQNKENFKLQTSNIKKEENREERMGMKVEVEEEDERETKLQTSNFKLQTEIEEEKKEEKEEIKLKTSHHGGQANLKLQEEEKKEEEIKEKEVVVEEDGMEEQEEIKLQTSNLKLQEEEKEKDKIKIEPKVKTPFPWGKVGVGLGIIVLFIGLFFSYFLWGVVEVVMGLDEPIKLLKERKIVEAKKIIEKKQKTNENVAWFWEKTKLGEVVKISRNVLEIETKLCALADSMEKINGAVFEEKTIDFKTELLIVSTKLLEVETEIGVVEARLAGVKKWIPGRWKPKINETTDLISKNVDLVGKLRQIVGVLPEILGLDGKRREYLVLLQNEMELRATGGFIGSYGVLSFQEGRLISFDIKDIYEADGQLRGHVEPPEEIKRYLGEAGWFMRDSNWKASFPQASKDIQWFFEKEVGRSVDGVMGVDLAVVKSMLNATGPIFVPDFKEKIDKDNLYEQAEFYSESKFFPGSVQKASFLGGMGRQLFAEVSSLKTGQKWNLMMGLIDVLEKNDLQMMFNEPTTAEVVGSLGWDGEVFEGKCGVKDCYGDYLYVVESNLGVNKVNYFLYRAMEQKIEIKNTSVERVLRISYENLAKTTAWPGGDYKNYLRIYLPKDVQVSEVVINTGGVIQNVALNEVKMTNVGEKREIGFLVTVPIGKKVVVEVKYASSMAQIGDKFSYMLYIQRQSGFGDTGMINLVSIPNGMQPMQVTPSASVVGGKLLFNQKLDRDIRLGVEVSK